MASVLCDVTLWLEHAKEVRALSEVISDPDEKEQMLVVPTASTASRNSPKKRRSNTADMEIWKVGLAVTSERMPARMNTT